MKNLLLILLVATAASCTNANTSETKAETGASSSTDNGNAAANIEVVKKYMDAELRGDTTAMSAVMTDDYIQYGLGVKDSANKQKTLSGIQHHWEAYKYGGKSYKDVETIAVTTTDDGGRGRGKGDWVLLWGDLSTIYPASPDYGNKSITATFAYHAAYRVKNGKVDTRTVYFNHEDIMRQLGYKMISVAEQQKPAAAGLKIK